MQIPRFSMLGAWESLAPNNAEEIWFSRLPPHIQEKFRPGTIPRSEISVRGEFPSWLNLVPPPLRKKIWEIHNKIAVQVPLIGASKKTPPAISQEEMSFYVSVLKEISKEKRPELPGEIKPKDLDKEVKENVRALSLLKKFREGEFYKAHPEFEQSDAQTAAQKFLRSTLRASRRVLQSNLVAAKDAKTNDDFVKIGKALKDAADKLLTAEVTKDLFKEGFPPSLREAQEAQFNAIVRDFTNITKIFHNKKIIHMDTLMSAGKKVLMEISQSVKSKNGINPELIDSIMFGINEIQKPAFAISSMRDVDNDIRKKAEETIILSETLKYVLNAYKDKFIPKTKKYTPPTSFQETASQKEKIFGFTLATDLLKEMLSNRSGPKIHKETILRIFSNAASELAQTRLDPENIEAAKTALKEARIPMRSIFVSNLSRAHGSSPISIFQRTGDPLVKWAITQGLIPSFMEDEHGNYDSDLFKSRTAKLQILTNPTFYPEGESAIDIIISEKLVSNPKKFITEIVELASKYTVPIPSKGDKEYKEPPLERAEKEAVQSVLSLFTALQATKEKRFHPGGSI